MMLITLVRSIILYLLLILTVRFMGKRQIGQLQPGELVITILISEIAVIPMQDNDIPMTHSILALLLLASFEIIMSVMALKSAKIRKILQGNSVVIIKDGVVQQKQLKKLRYTIDDLLEALRQQGVFNISDVQYAIAETDGSLSILLKPEKRSVAIENTNFSPNDDGLKTVIIADGKIIKTELKNLGISREALKTQLAEKGLIAKNILLMETDKNGNINIIRREE